VAWKAGDERAKAEAALAALAEEERLRAEVEAWKSVTAAFDSEDEDDGDHDGGNHVKDAGSPSDAKDEDSAGACRETARPDRVDARVPMVVGYEMEAKAHLVSPTSS
jgi:hypothetical protein